MCRTAGVWITRDETVLLWERTSYFLGFLVTNEPKCRFLAKFSNAWWTPSSLSLAWIFVRIALACFYHLYLPDPKPQEAVNLGYTSSLPPISFLIPPWSLLPNLHQLQWWRILRPHLILHIPKTMPLWFTEKFSKNPTGIQLRLYPRVMFRLDRSTFAASSGTTESRFT